MKLAGISASRWKGTGSQADGVSEGQLVQDCLQFIDIQLGIVVQVGLFLSIGVAVKHAAQLEPSEEDFVAAKDRGERGLRIGGCARQ